MPGGNRIPGDFYEIGKAMRCVQSLIFILLVIFCSCQVDKPRKYIPATARGREKYATPEPGTYLRPMAYVLVNEVNRYRTEPDTYKEPSDRIKEIFVSHQKRLVDTLIRQNGLEVPVRIYYPTRRSLQGNHPVTLFIHGGGFIMGSVEEYHIMVSKLARITDQIIVSVNYRLAPEFPFPAGLDDCFAVLGWLQEHAGSMGGDTSRISVMGDSAGGNLATVLTIRCRDEGRPQPYCQVLLYPGVSFADTTYPSLAYFAYNNEQPYILTAPFMRKATSLYMGEETNARHPYLSPLEAELTSDLAPALVITAECDPIRDGGRLYAEKMEKQGMRVEHIEYSGMVHGFMNFHMIFKEALDAMKYIREFQKEE